MDCRFSQKQVFAFSIHCNCPIFGLDESSDYNPFENVLQNKKLG
jgi:hypothetical protein